MHLAVYIINCVHPSAWKASTNATASPLAAWLPTASCFAPACTPCPQSPHDPCRQPRPSAGRSVKPEASVNSL
ncbi:hypothetical protein BDY17DRAFT_292324 [Neohortaea acidophila]|uniref:Uncharacterized protein n=1 Tax=Neohortaea acidophila TaxID=245834 RepID=A0A6A6Q4J2_9PEZI|nr:uncharacterized protein BDY17DRAFT_292324 [Neohortaea acidophila]KAF2486904.1 hypothetical protein BDY17DRAFT_292324 [Neohortaea acidophila]